MTQHAGRVARTRAVAWVALVATGIALAAATPAYSADAEPGTLPDSTRSAAASARSAAAASTRSAAASAPAAAPASAGLQVQVNERGRISRSIAGVGGDDPSGGTLTVRKPAGATVRGAYLAVATTGGSGARLTDPVRIDGQPVPITNEIATSIQSYNYFADVTALLGPKINAAPAGVVSFTVTEPEPGLVDGEMAVVIYNDPAVGAERTVSILYGALSPTGDQYQVQLAAPIRKADPATHLEMSLGISFSYQSLGSQQYSTVDINGRRLTSSAGGEDDGADHNGALLTIGGEGDSTDNPGDPDAPPTEPRSDDELYNLSPLVNEGDTRITVTTANPSLDDNMMLATFTMNPPVTAITPESRPAYVAVGDSTTTGFSVPTCHENRVASPFGCVGTPPATPYPDRIATDPRFADIKRVGIWGYTIHEAVTDADNGHNAKGPWTPQLVEAANARGLVTVSLGANDMRFSDVLFWFGVCLGGRFAGLPTCQVAARARAESLRTDIEAMMRRLDAAAGNGARVVITLYYNPYNIVKEAGPFNLLSRDCTPLWAISAIITANLNRVLRQAAQQHNFTVVDLGPLFVGHGAGARDSYVFGSDCDAVGAATAARFRLGWPPSVDREASLKEIWKRFDPHPNAKGTEAQADQITEAVSVS